MTEVEKLSIGIERASISNDGALEVSLNFYGSDIWGTIHFTMTEKSVKPIRDAATQLCDFSERLYEFIKEG